ncbi:MAG: hypothetical protein IJB15_13670 [Clostridia bacterium]|nr:hypothetical protein [Clostridia bacterium]
MKIALQKYMHLADGKDAVPAIRAALADCQPGDTLCLGGGLLHLYPEHTAVRPYYVSNNDYSDKHIAFDLQNRRDLTIDGEGAELLFHGHVTPFVLDHAENITIRNLHVDYRNPFFIQAKITGAGEDFTELTFDGDTFACTLKDGKLCFYSPEDGWESVEEKVLVTEFDDNGRPSPYLGPYFTVLTPQEESFLSGMYRYFDAEQVTENTIRLNGRIGYTHTVGNWWVCTFGGRHNPGIFITDSKNITLCDLELYHTAAMGVIGQCSENITLERVNCRVRPGSGRVLSVSADATHFVNCSGKISYKDCTFTSMLDDAGNFHGIYTIVQEKTDDHTVLLRYGHPQQRGINLYRPGDRIRLVNNHTMLPYAELTVQKSVLLSGECLQLTVEEVLPADMTKDHVIENHTRMPKVHLDGCVCGNNRPRGFLLTTCKTVLVENCTFFNMNCAIECAGDANSSFESGPVTDVTIRNNRFVDSAYAGGYVISICPAVKENIGQTYHHGITVENNHFRLHEKRFLYARHTAGLVFRNNIYTQDLTLPSHPVGEANGMHTDVCPDAVLEEPAVL